MYTISQFSKLSGFTVKTLRYYDEEDILKPSYRDQLNQYRYYNDDDLQQAHMILFLRSIDFSIMEIKETLKLVEEKNDLNYILQEKREQIERQISQKNEIIEKIKNISEEIENGNQNHDYQITEKHLEPILVASIRFKGPYQEISRYVPILYKAVKNQRAGCHMSCYYDDACVDIADIELCIPIKKEISQQSVICQVLPQEHVLSTTHYGSYETLYLAYKALFEYAYTHRLKLTIPAREVYKKGLGMIFSGNPARYVTEVYIPFEKEREEV